MNSLSRRAFVAQTFSIAAFSAQAFAAAPKWAARQYHNQPASSPLHEALVSIWSAVKVQTGGRLEVTVYPQNNQIAGSDPAALKLLQEGGLEFYTLMGGILANVVPAMDVQGLPFVFKTPRQVYRLNRGPLGRHLDAECRAKGIERIAGGLLENGFRQLNLVEKPVRNLDDLAGLKIRVPDGQMFRDFFGTIGAQPVTLNINRLYDALKDKSVDGQENPLVIAHTNKLFEVTKYMSMSNHMWSGFNLLSNGDFWKRLPPDVRAIIERNVVKYVEVQRKVTDDLNVSLEATLKERGMVFNTPDTSSFARKLADGFYGRWKTQLGSKTWAVLEAGVGKVG
jgi:tripartite ATP-independent transporter DctP family solute receptor